MRLQFESQRYRKAVPEKRANFVAFMLSLLPLTKFLKNDRMKRKRKAIGTVYAFFTCGTMPYTSLVYTSIVYIINIYTRVRVYIFIYTHVYKYVCIYNVCRG